MSRDYSSQREKAKVTDSLNNSDLACPEGSLGTFSHVGALEYRRATQVLPPEACHRWDLVNLLFVSCNLWMTLTGRCLPSLTTRESLPRLVWRPRYHASRCRDIPVFWLKRTHVCNVGHERKFFIHIEDVTLICVQKITKKNHWHDRYLLTQKLLKLSIGSEHYQNKKLKGVC